MATYNKPLSEYEYGDIFTVEEFKELVKEGMFIDYDGSGIPAKLEGVVDDSINIYPSRLDKIPEDATHVIWFNK